MEIPSLHAIGAMILTVLSFWIFASGRLRIEIASLLLIAILALLLYLFPLTVAGREQGIDLAFSGFGHEALVAICCLMIMGRGLVVTGALEPAAQLLTRLWRYSRLLGLLFSLLLGGALSMFVNDTPVLVLIMPILLNLAARSDVPASKTLMPMNCAILIGGMTTTIGTSTNLLVVSIAEDMGLRRFGIFDFADTALIAAAIALPYLWLVMPRLLPVHTTMEELSTRRFQAGLHVGAASPAVGLTLGELRRKAGAGATVIGIARRDKLFTEPEIPVVSSDIIRVEGTSAQLRDLCADLKVALSYQENLDAVRAFARQNGEDEVVAELVVGSDSTLIGRTVKGMQIADRYGVVVIGYYQPERQFLHGVEAPFEGRLEIGDVLLVLGTQSTLRNLQLGEGAMVLDGAAEMPRSHKAPIALAIFAAVVFFAATHLVPIAIAALAGTIGLLATGCLKFDRLGQALSAKVIVLVAASIALGRALLETGAAGWLGEALALGLQHAPPAGVLAAMMAFSALLTNFSSNTAAAAVGTPIAISLGRAIGIPPEPLVLAVLFGCNLCYATPIAYQTNILIMSAGGYQFRDYVRAGLPLVFIMITALSILLVLKYGL